MCGRTGTRQSPNIMTRALWEREAGRFQVLAQPGQFSEPLSEKGRTDCSYNLSTREAKEAGLQRVQDQPGLRSVFKAT